MKNLEEVTMARELTEEEINDELQASLDKKLLEPRFIDMKKIVGIEITECAAFIAVLEQHLHIKLKAYPNFYDDMYKLEMIRKNKIVIV